jgi:hypothetical protein
MHHGRTMEKVIESCLVHRESNTPWPDHGEGDRVLSTPWGKRQSPVRPMGKVVQSVGPSRNRNTIRYTVLSLLWATESESSFLWSQLSTSSTSTFKRMGRLLTITFGLLYSRTSYMK